MRTYFRLNPGFTAEDRIKEYELDLFDRSTGCVGARVLGGNWWSMATESATLSHYMVTNPTLVVHQNNNFRVLGFAVRCVGRCIPPNPSETALVAAQELTSLPEKTAAAEYETQKEEAEGETYSK